MDRRLVGRTVNALWVSDDRCEVVFETDQGRVGYTVEPFDEPDAAALDGLPGFAALCGQRVEDVWGTVQETYDRGADAIERTVVRTQAGLAVFSHRARWLEEYSPRSLAHLYRWVGDLDPRCHGLSETQYLCDICR